MSDQSITGLRGRNPLLSLVFEKLRSQALRASWLLWLALAMGGLSLLATDSTFRLSILVSALTLATLAALLRGNSLVSRAGMPRRLKGLLTFLAEDTAPSLVLDADQRVVWCNPAAQRLCPEVEERGLEHGLRALTTDAPVLLRSLRRGLMQSDCASQDAVVRRGHARFVLRSYPRGYSLLRLEAMAERTQVPGANIALPILTVSQNGTVLAMNEALRRLVGRRVRRLEDLFAETPDAQTTHARLDTLDGPVPAQLYQTVLSAGRREIAILPETGQPSPVNARDLALSHVPVAMLKMRADGTILDANAPARSLLNLEDGEVPPPFADLMSGLGRSVSSWLKDAVASPCPLQPEVLQLRNGDQDNYLQVSLSRADFEGVPILVAVLQDATELKTLEAQFVQSQKMQAIGQLAGGVAHDFNNLLTAISGHCDLLLLRHDRDDPEYGDLVQINQNANRAASLVGQLLAFSRKQTLQPEALDLRDTLSDLTHLLNRLVGEKVKLTLLNDPDLCTIRADKRQLEQVLMNLVVNARDAMPDGGRITIETRRIQFETPLVKGRATLPAGEYSCVSVSDDGVGIPKEHLSKIFEPFFTTKRTGEGTGLGLSTAYGIVKQSGGFIFAESLPGKGSEFQLFFPAHHQTVSEPSPQAEPVAERPSAPGEGVVLLVEDEAPVRAFAARALRLNGYTVLEAENAEVALDMLSNEALEVDVFVTDVIMPGLDGPTWVRQARQERPSAKVIFMSGYAEDLLSGDHDPVPNSVFLPKPFSLTQLTATVQAQFD